MDTSVIGFDDSGNLICTGDNTGCLDNDQDGSYVDCYPVDCDDTNGSIHPEALEVCDGLDNNCDNIVDPGGMCDGAVVPSAGDLQIVEVMANPSGDEFNREWVEIVNVSDSILNLHSCWITAGTISSLTATSGIGVGQLAVLAPTANPAANGGLPQVDVLTAVLDLPNPSGEIWIGCGDLVTDNVIATFQWANTSDGVSVQIDGNGIQCNTPAGITYGVGDTGTPGIANPDCP
jgi:hypothetical protein